MKHSLKNLLQRYVQAKAVIEEKIPKQVGTVTVTEQQGPVATVTEEKPDQEVSVEAVIKEKIAEQKVLVEELIDEKGNLSKRKLFTFFITLFFF